LSSAQNGTPSREGVLFFTWSETLASLVLAVAFFGLFHIYALAFTFGASLDDAWNLAGLERITDRQSALEFVFGGIAGPLGRPLSLLTFLPQWASWPSAPQDFLFQNALIHLTNFLLVTWIAIKLARHLPWEISSPHWFAVAAGILWGFSPLLFSTTAMIIQRMTSLSALFCLLGILGYLVGRERLDRNWRAALLIMSGSILGGTLLSALCKENGALLPGFVLILEKLILQPSLNASRPTRCAGLFRAQFVAFCVLPSLAILGYLLLNLPEFAAGHRSRGFSLDQRLLTESRIVLQYAKLLLVPVRSSLTPFNDDFPLSDTLFDAKTLGAVAFILLSLFFSWRWRQGNLRLFSFAACWFLWGHITESTVVPLELYFEHRNYLPAVGPIFALVAALFHPLVASGLRVAFLSTIIAMSAFVLRETALLWSDSRVAAEIWYSEHPSSLRSLQFLLISLSKQRRYDEYLEVVDSVSSPLRDGSEYAMMRVVAYCGLREPEQVMHAVSVANQRLKAIPFRPSVTDMLDSLADGVPSGECPGMSIDDVKGLLESVLANQSPKIRSDVHAQAHEILARLIVPERNLNAIMYHLEEAYRLRPTTSVGIAMANILTSAGLYDAAEGKLEDLKALEPRRPFLGKGWNATISEMRDIIRSTRIESGNP
jgi:hypothetical protein